MEILMSQFKIMKDEMMKIEKKIEKKLNSQKKETRKEQSLVRKI